MPKILNMKIFNFPKLVDELGYPDIELSRPGRAKVRIRVVGFN